MKTVSVNVMNLCVPCENRCRYCLLSYDGKIYGADYRRSEAYAKRFYQWLQENRPDLSFLFGFGYSMEHPHLLEAISFCRSIGSATGEFLQLDGIKFRDDAQLYALFASLKDSGIQQTNLTFYGTEQYHDHFAARSGDYGYMLRMLRIANDIGLPASVGVPLTHENTMQAAPLLEELGHFALTNLRFFVPHGEGRGKALESIRFSQKDYDMLSEDIKSRFNRTVYRPEKDWVASAPHLLPQRRVLTLTLTADNMTHFEQMPFDDTIAYLEELDEAYYAAIPDLNQLIRRYGDPQGENFYSLRDLHLAYQRRFIAEHNLNLYDVNDERHCFSRRF